MFKEKASALKELEKVKGKMGGAYEKVKSLEKNLSGYGANVESGKMPTEPTFDELHPPEGIDLPTWVQKVSDTRKELKSQFDDYRKSLDEYNQAKGDYESTAGYWESIYGKLPSNYGVPQSQPPDNGSSGSGKGSGAFDSPKSSVVQPQTAKTPKKIVFTDEDAK